MFSEAPPQSVQPNQSSGSVKMIIEILIFLLTSLICYYIYVHKKIHYYFDRIGVKYLPGIPVLGNTLKSAFLKRHTLEDIDEVYKAFPNEKYVGYIEGTTPILLIRDPEIIKLTTVKDFDHFVNHRMFFDPDTEPLFGSSLIMMKDERWRDMRTTLSPAFTGSKMRHMMPFMTEISGNIVEYLKENKGEITDVDDLMRRYTNDVIASTAFGLQVNSLKDKDNEFYKTGQSLFKFTAFQRFIFVITAQFPQLVKKLNIKMFKDETIKFFKDLVSRTIDYRIKNNVKRPDMIQLLMEASKGTLEDTNQNDKDEVGFAMTQELLKPRDNIRKWTDDELTSQVFIFFAAGFESSANALVMIIHELAINPKIQDKLYQEIKKFKEAKGELTYDNIGELKYLDCVINESARKWAVAIIMDRVCNRPYKLPPPRKGADPVELKSGDIIYNLVNSLHMDPKYYPNPEVFDPDRFSDENKHKINPFAFTPFGAGPRNCIGSRFALLELKIIIYSLLLNFRIAKCEKTSDPIKLKPSDFTISALGGTFVKFEHRE